MTFKFNNNRKTISSEELSHFLNLASKIIVASTGATSETFNDVLYHLEDEVQKLWCLENPNLSPTESPYHVASQTIQDEEDEDDYTDDEMIRGETFSVDEREVGDEDYTENESKRKYFAIRVTANMNTYGMLEDSDRDFFETLDRLSDDDPDAELYEECNRSMHTVVNEFVMNQHLKFLTQNNRVFTVRDVR